MNGTNLRKWATPLTIGAFVLCAFSGIMMFFHLSSGSIKGIHELGGWLLVVGGLLHVLGSWQPFIRHFAQPIAVAIMAIFVLASISCFIPFSGTGPKERGRRPPRESLSAALPAASFLTVAQIAKHQPDELMKELETKGIAIGSKDTPIREIARVNNRNDVEILDMIF